MTEIGKVLATECCRQGIELSATEIKQFEIYADELKKWNRKVNLTAITKDAEIAIKHFADSLMLVNHLLPHDILLDIGSGAGLPVIPLKIVRPDIAMISVDAVAKKIHFQRHIIRLLNLKDIEAIHARVEELHVTHSEKFTMVTSRAFTRLDRFVALAAPLVAPGGRLIAMKDEQADDLSSAPQHEELTAGFAICAIQRYKLPFCIGERVVTVLKRCESA